jgi:hypothetical protein
MTTNKRKPGGQPGNSNAVTHGRYSASVRAARRAAAAAAAEEQRATSQRWAELMPSTNYAAICEEIKRQS